MAERLVACGRFDLIVLDALADLPPGGETTMAVGRFVRVITPRLGADQAARHRSCGCMGGKIWLAI